MKIQTDIFISGGGLAGMIAAIAFAKAGFSVTCADPHVSLSNFNNKEEDLRTTAFLLPSKLFLETIDVWKEFENFSVPLTAMRIIEARGTDKETKIRVQKEFRSEDLSTSPFGWNVPNWLARKSLIKIIQKTKNIQFLSKIETVDLFLRDSGALVYLENGSTINANMVIGADGRSSLVREKSGIKVIKKNFDQSALSFVVTHDHQHKNITTEIHLKGGPFTLIPLPNYNDKPSSAIVWMEKNKETDLLLGLQKNEFEKKIRLRSCDILGKLKLQTSINRWPILSQLAVRLSTQRVVLIAEAAHVVPPIGAQGLNMSLLDIKTILELAKKSPNSVGDENMVREYHNIRINDLRKRVSGISILNQISISENQIAQDIRVLGLKALHEIKPIRKSLMKLGLGH